MNILYSAFDFVGVVSKRYKRFSDTPQLFVVETLSVNLNDDWLSVVFLEQSTC